MSPPSSADPARASARRRWGARLLLVLAAVLLALVFGVTTASVESSLGPHEARYDVTTDDEIVVDLGPLGTLQIGSPLPLTLGVHVTVQEIPASVTELSQAKTLEALSGDLQSYLQFFSGPQATVQDVGRALVVDALGRAGAALVVLVVAFTLLRALVGTVRWGELAARAAPHRREVVAAAVVAVLGASVLTSSVGQGDRPVVISAASPVFDGTPLEGARVTGRLGGVINTYGGQVIAELRKNNAFYAQANTSLEVAWDERQAQIDDAASPAATSTPTPTLSRSSTADPSTPSPTIPAGVDEADLVTVVVISDLHCNVGMAPLIHTLVERADANLVLDAGDTTLNGTTVEQYCVTTFARAVPQGVELVTSQGNHDSRETSKLYARAGATVLDGSVVTVDGLRILGDKDPNETRVGAGGTASAGTESAEEEGARLAQTACDDSDGVDLLLIHTPAVGQDALDQGCVPAQISGHLHHRYGPDRVGLGIRYISSSTAGATLGQPTVGPLHGVAEMTVLRWDPESRRFVDYQLVQVRPDASADVSPRLRWPSATPVPAVPGAPDGRSPV